MYADEIGTTWNKNATKVAITTKKVKSTDALQINLSEGGGTAIRFKKL